MLLKMYDSYFKKLQKSFIEMKALGLTTRMVYTHSTSRWWRPIGRSPIYLMMATIEMNQIVRGKCPNIANEVSAMFLIHRG